MAAQKSINAAAGIGIQPQAADFSTDRAAGIANRLATTQNFDDIDWLLQEPIVNFSRAVVDDTMKKNAEFLSQTGGQQYVTRKVVGSCCEWCSKLAGTYKYPDEVPKDFFRRHQRCRCVIDGNYDKKKSSKKVSKKADGDTQAKREKIGLLGADKRRPTVDISGNGGIIKKEPLKINIQLFAKNSSDFPTVQLPKQEYAKVMSEIATHLTEEQKNSPVFVKRIADKVYTIENSGFGNYRIIKRKKRK